VGGYSALFSSLNKAVLLAAAAVSAVFGPTARAATCHVAKVAEFPVTMTGMRPMVHVGIDGHDTLFEADSGAFHSTISPQNASALGLHLEAGNMSIGGVGGSQRAWVTRVKALTLAGVTIPSVEFVVGGREMGVVGLLGQNVLGLYDTEYDLAHGAIRMIKADGCEKTMMAYWTKPGDPMSVIEIERQDQDQPHIQAKVSINDTSMDAIFDTGGGLSILSLKAAARLGLKPGMANAEQAGMIMGIGRKLVATWVVPIASFRIGDEQIKNTRLRIGDLGDAPFDMVLGADFFLSHRLFVAKHQNKLYLSYVGGHVFDLSHGTGR
jgi:predicted aspartyl protease